MPKPSAARTPSRERILAAASRLFGANGFHATSIDDIQREAGVLRGSLYFHFNGKEALALEVLDRFFEAVSAALVEAFDSKSGGALDRLAGVFGTIPDSMALQEYRGGCLLGSFGQELSGSEAIRLRVRERFELLIAAVARFLARARAEGALASGLAPKAGARLFVCAFHGALIELRVYKDRSVYDECMSVALAAMRGRA